jgi:hypothetical protein
MSAPRWWSWINPVALLDGKSRKRSRRQRKPSLPRSRGPQLEQFEQRLLLSISPSLFGPDEVEQGSMYTLQLAAAGDAAQRWEINWGDGTKSSGTAGDWGNDITERADGTWAATHCYEDDAVRFVTAKAYDAASMAFIPAQPEIVVVNDAAPVLSMTSMGSIDGGKTYSLILTSSDFGGDALAGWSIDWGDGTTSTGTRPKPGTALAPEPIPPWLADDPEAAIALGPAAWDNPPEIGEDWMDGPYAKWLEPGWTWNDVPPIVPATEKVDSHDWGDGIIQIAEDRWVVAHAYAAEGDYRVTAGATDAKGTYSVFGAAGNVDTRFGERGTATVDFGPGVETHCREMTVQPDGKIVLVGYVVDGSTRRPAVARLNADGTPDATFHGTGTRTVDTLAELGALLAMDGAIDIELDTSRLAADLAEAALPSAALLEPTVAIKPTVGPALPVVSLAETTAERLTATDAAGGTLVARDDFSVARLFEEEAALDLGGGGGMLMMMSPPTTDGTLSLAGLDEIDEGDTYVLTLTASDLVLCHTLIVG